jgi:hypothetical protein
VAFKSAFVETVIRGVQSVYRSLAASVSGASVVKCLSQRMWIRRSDQRGDADRMSIDCQIYGQPTRFMVFRFPTMPRKRRRRITLHLQLRDKVLNVESVICLSTPSLDTQITMPGTLPFSSAIIQNLMIDVSLKNSGNNLSMRFLLSAVITGPSWTPSSRS